jgi:hypothetical protein
MCVVTSCLCSDEVNLLIQHYLQELSYDCAAFAFAYESRIPFQQISQRPVPSGSLVYLVQKGMILSQIEAAASRAPNFPSSVPTTLGQLHQELRQQLETLQKNADASSKLPPLDRLPCFLDDRSALLLVAHSRGITSVAFSPDCDRLATASMDGSAAVWRIDPNRHTIFDLPLLLDADVTCLAWSRDSTLLAGRTDLAREKSDDRDRFPFKSRPTRLCRYARPRLHRAPRHCCRSRRTRPCATSSGQAMMQHATSACTVSH